MTATILGAAAALALCIALAAWYTSHVIADAVAHSAFRITSPLHRSLGASNDNAHALADRLERLIELQESRSSERYLHRIRSDAARTADHLAAVVKRMSEDAPLPLGPSLVGRTVVVHTRDEQSLRGLVLAEYSDRIDLEQAQWLLAKGGSEAAGGVQSIPRSNVRVTQVLPAQIDSE